MELNTNSTKDTEQKRLDITVTLASGNVVTHQIRSEYNDKWAMDKGILTVRLYHNVADQEPSEEHIYFGGHIAGISYRHYTMMTRVPDRPSVLDKLLPEKRF